MAVNPSRTPKSQGRVRSSRINVCSACAGGRMEQETWLGIDLGTQSVRALLVTADGTVLGSGSAPLRGRRDGVRHEQDPGEWWTAVCMASRAALRDHSGGVGGLAVCGTSGTVLLTDDAGRPVSPALMYDD